MERFPQSGSYTAPRLAHARVCDAMRHGIFSAPASTSLREAARTMSTHHIHAVLVSDPATGSMSAILTDGELLAALLDGDGERLLGEVETRALDTISSSESLLPAAELMRERGISHLVVRDADSGQPTGMLSTFDVLGVLAWGEA